MFIYYGIDLFLPTKGHVTHTSRSTEVSSFTVYIVFERALGLGALLTVSVLSNLKSESHVVFSGPSTNRARGASWTNNIFTKLVDVLKCALVVFCCDVWDPGTGLRVFQTVEVSPECKWFGQVNVPIVQHNRSSSKRRVATSNANLFYLNK